MIDFELVDLARGLVRDQIPDPRAAWLGGSVVAGTSTATSDLDITILLAGPPAPYRETLRYHGQLVELFVHTEESLAHYCQRDLDRRVPTMLRLIGESIILADQDGSGATWQRRCLDRLRTGPEPATADELAERRYRITNLVGDLGGTDDPLRIAAIGSQLLTETADLLLIGSKHWSGAGKALVSELEHFDAATGGNWRYELFDAGREAWIGDPAPIAKLADQILQRFGGPLLDGYRAAPRTPIVVLSAD